MAISLRKLLSQNEFWVFLFVIGWIMLNWPMLAMVVGSFIWDIPTILIYVALIWMLIILALYIYDRGYSG